MRAPTSQKDGATAAGQDRIAEALVDFALALEPAAIPAAVLERARLLILDGCGVAIAAVARDLDRPYAEGLRFGGGDGRHRVIGREDGWSMRDAAFLNGVLIHAIEFDDTHMEAVLHPTATVLPAVLAAAEHVEARDEEILSAYVAGVEIAARLGGLAPGRFQASGFHPTGVIGCFAAMIGAGKLLGLDRGQMAAGLGIALSTAAGSMQFLQGGGIGKSLHAGWAAQSGLTAAVLASRGLAGAGLPFSGRHGLFESFSRGLPDADRVEARLASLGRDWETLSVAVKPYPAAFYSHGCIEAAVHLAVAYSLAERDIAAVEIVVPPPVLAKLAEPVAAKTSPGTITEAQFALPFLVARALVAHRFGLGELRLESLSDPATLALAQRVICRGDAAMDFPRVYPGEVHLYLRDGSRLCHRVPVNLGAGDRPVDAGFILAKFRDNLGNTPTKRLGRIHSLFHKLI